MGEKMKEAQSNGADCVFSFFTKGGGNDDCLWQKIFLW
jgi:hypothetical protein